MHENKIMNPIKIVLKGERGKEREVQGMNLFKMLDEHV
jgi:hypothetical protein